MTWKEFVDAVKAAGVQDTDVLDFIDVADVLGQDEASLTIESDPLTNTFCVSNY